MYFIGCLSLSNRLEWKRFPVWLLIIKCTCSFQLFTLQRLSVCVSVSVFRTINKRRTARADMWWNCLSDLLDYFFLFILFFTTWLRFFSTRISKEEAVLFFSHLYHATLNSSRNNLCVCVYLYERVREGVCVCVCLSRCCYPPQCVRANDFLI